MVPGTSRSGATIISGMMAGIPRKTATAFSFFLAMPTMLAATVYDLSRTSGSLDDTKLTAILAGLLASFGSALGVVRSLLRFRSPRPFRSYARVRVVQTNVVRGEGV